MPDSASPSVFVEDWKKEKQGELEVSREEEEMRYRKGNRTDLLTMISHLILITTL